VKLVFQRTQTDFYPAGKGKESGLKKRENLLEIDIVGSFQLLIETLQLLIFDLTF